LPPRSLCLYTYIYTRLAIVFYPSMHIYIHKIRNRPLSPSLSLCIYLRLAVALSLSFPLSFPLSLWIIIALSLSLYIYIYMLDSQSYGLSLSFYTRDSQSPSISSYIYICQTHNRSLSHIYESHNRSLSFSLHIHIRFTMALSLSLSVDTTCNRPPSLSLLRILTIPLSSYLHKTRNRSLHIFFERSLNRLCLTTRDGLSLSCLLRLFLCRLFRLCAPCQTRSHDLAISHSWEATRLRRREREGEKERETKPPHLKAAQGLSFFLSFQAPLEAPSALELPSIEAALHICISLSLTLSQSCSQFAWGLQPMSCHQMRWLCVCISMCLSCSFFLALCVCVGMCLRP